MKEVLDKLKEIKDLPSTDEKKKQEIEYVIKQIARVLNDEIFKAKAFSYLKLTQDALSAFLDKFTK
jgi:hypothetical protein